MVGLDALAVEVIDVTEAPGADPEVADDVVGVVDGAGVPITAGSFVMGDIVPVSVVPLLVEVQTAALLANEHSSFNVNGG